MNDTTYWGEAPRASAAPNENARPLGEGVERKAGVLIHSTALDPLGGWLALGRPRRLTKRKWSGRRG